MLIDTNQSVGDAESSFVGNVLSDLKQTRDQLVEYQSLTAAVKNATLSVDSALGASRTLLPAAQSAMSDATQVGSDVQGMIDSSKTVVDQLSVSLDSINQLALQSLNDANSAMETAFALLQKDSGSASDKILEAKAKVDSALSLAAQARDALQQIQDKLPSPLTGIQTMIDKLNELISKEQGISDALGTAASTIRTTGQIPETVRKDLEAKFTDALAAASDVVTVFDSQTKPALDTLITDMYGSIGSLSSLLTTAGSTAPALDSALGSMSDSMGYAVSALDSTDTLIGDAVTKIDGFISEIESATSDQRLSKLVDLLTRDPNLVAAFMSSPVDVTTTSLYPIENYGSAMTPFYTILCLWVGALINCAILKVHIKDNDGIGDLTPNQGYFGRYLLFMFTGIMQALIVTLGDLYMLRIQCLHPVLFILAGVVASIVFTNLVYTLVVSFGNVGKAVAVILLVIQVAGAGGTFPIETLPQFYQSLYPWFPFTYGINAMRECVAGIYQNHYLVDILKLLCFIPFSLLLGLVLRKPIIKMNAYLESKLEETDIIG